MRKGALLIISAPSGAGKTTICRKLLARRKDLRYSVSCTTRAPRAGEKDGKAYFFLTREDFKRKITRGEFLEWAMVHDEYYGTPRRFVDDVIKTGENVIMAIDVQGAMSIRRKHPAAILVFVLPPSLDELEARLRKRATDAPDVIERRLAKAKDELKQYGLYQYLIVNDDLPRAYERLRAIYLASQCTIDRTGPIAESLVKEAEHKKG